MPRCKVNGCNNTTRYKNTEQIYCVMHLARISRHGDTDPKRDAYRALEKLPHKIVDAFIRKNCQKMIDEEIVEELRKKGFKKATLWTVKYRRRKLGIKKYLYGEIKKHKAWIRAQAIKEYGDGCELCWYKISVETHHIIPKYQGGPHEINNLIVVCPNCHALMTKQIITLTDRKEIPRIRKKILKLLKSSHPNFE